MSDFLSDLDIEYDFDGKYNHGTNHRWDFSPTRKTLEGRRFLMEVTSPRRGDRLQPYLKNLREKVTRARRAGDIVIVLKFGGRDPGEVLEFVLFPAFLRHGII